MHEQILGFSDLPELSEISIVKTRLFVAHITSILTLGSNGPKNSVTQRGVEPQSLTFQVSIYRPQRHLFDSPSHSLPLRGKCVLTLLTKQTIRW